MTIPVLYYMENISSRDDTQNIFDVNRKLFLSDICTCTSICHSSLKSQICIEEMDSFTTAAVFCFFLQGKAFPLRDWVSASYLIDNKCRENIPCMWNKDVIIPTTCI